ncbi:ABC transporter substrate-binding protein [Paenibacillus sp. SC116]|uniref:ABC transporter substrate-binding protein n=1 Tax=Paenibacillus sp. SC116 TaxID=2968986 RepID=UPI00215AE7C1|nr:ABC transporter substrate-binding protein [Paenibacillus sp. SC116]MCR8842172.1 ABC transporter substrate-binding protein [Paenibacillus sp. SC116]
MSLQIELQLNKSTVALGDSRKTNLAEVKAFIDEHYDEAISIGMLADMANVCPKYFVDLFKKTFGQSTMDYVTNVRINHAKRHLVETDCLLRDIAVKVGYKDEFYFSRKFKKEVGISPSDFAKNSRRVIAAYSASIIGYLLPLNVMPIVAPLDAKWTPYYYNVYQAEVKSHLKLSAPYHDSHFEENVDKVFQAKPDAIIGMDHLSEEEINKLDQIAPALIVPSQEGWREQLRMIADFLHREKQAQQWIEQYEQRVEYARSQIQPVVGQESVLALRIFGSSIHVYSNRGLEEVLYQDLQLEAAYGINVRNNQAITVAKLLQRNPDRIFIAVCPEAASRRYWLGLQHSIEWRKLKAVVNRNVYMISADPWFEYSPLGISRMLDETLLHFTGNCPNGLLDNSHGVLFAT